MILQPPSTLLIGPAGSGKTSAIATQLLAGLHVFVVVTEPNGIASLLNSCERVKAPIDNLHWSLCTPAASGWMELEDLIMKVSTMNQKQLSDQRNMGKSAFRKPMLKFLRAFSNFHCDRTNVSYGDFTKWGDDCFLNIDSLTGWSMMAFGCVVGYKPTPNMGEWGIAQNVVFNLLTKINADRRCFFNLTAHMEKEADDLTGIKKIMVSTIGAKLAPKIPPFFSEVIRCERQMVQGNKARFTWSTIDTQMDLKNRSLPISNTLEADFRPVIDAFVRRLKLAGGNTTSRPPYSVAPGAKIVPMAAPMTTTPPKAT